jgi:hypothetical protein
VNKGHQRSLHEKGEESREASREKREEESPPPAVGKGRLNQIRGQIQTRLEGDLNDGEPRGRVSRETQVVTSAQGSQEPGDAVAALWAGHSATAAQRRWAGDASAWSLWAVGFPRSPILGLFGAAIRPSQTGLANIQAEGLIWAAQIEKERLMGKLQITPWTVGSSNFIMFMNLSKQHQQRGKLASNCNIVLWMPNVGSHVHRSSKSICLIILVYGVSSIFYNWQYISDLMVAKYRSILVAGKRKKIMKEKKREVVFDLRIWWNGVVLIEMESELPQKNRTNLFNSIIF